MNTKKRIEVKYEICERFIGRWSSVVRHTSKRRAMREFNVHKRKWPNSTWGLCRVTTEVLAVAPRKDAKP